MNKNLVYVLVLVLIIGLGIYYRTPNKTENTNTENNTANTEVSQNLEANEKALNITNTSKATYEIDEVLNGNPVRVVGNNNSLSGFIALDTTTNKITRAEISLDANSFVTDIAKRDENVESLVLKTNEEINKVITFKSTNIEGLPENVVNNQNYNLKITGDLTISGITKQTTFDTNVIYKDDGSLEGTAKTSLFYEDFGLKIPDFPFLSNVSKQVDLTVNILAK